MTSVALLLLLAFHCEARADPSTVSAEDPIQEATFSSLDEALASSQSSILILELLPARFGHFLSKPREILGEVVINGQNQTIAMSATLNIIPFGSLTIWNATLVASTTVLDQAFNIKGTCIFQHTAIQGFHFPLCWVYGLLLLTDLNVTQGSAVTVVIAGEGAEVHGSDIQIKQLSAAFLITQIAEFQQYPFKVRITDSLFANNSGNSLLHIWRMYGEVEFISSEFSLNRCPLVYADWKQLRISCEKCLYHHNSGTFLSGYMQASQVALSNSLFSDISQPFVALHQFTGDFLFVNSTLTRHQSPLILSIAGESVDKSRVTFQDSTISNSNVTIITPIDGGIALYSCFVLFSKVHILNVTRKADYFKQLNSLIYVRLSQLWALNFTVHYSGSSSFFMAVTVGNMHLESFSFEHLYTGAGMFVQVADGLAWVREGYVEMAEYIRMKEVGPYFEYAVGFGMISSKVEISSVRIGKSEQAFGAGLVMYYSFFQVSNLTLIGMSLATPMASMESSGALTDVLFSSILSFWNVILATRGVLTITRLAAIDVRMGSWSINYSLFAFFGKCEVTMSDITVSNLTAEAFLRAKGSIVTMRKVSIEGSALGLVFHYLLNSYIVLSDFTLGNSVTKLVQLYATSVFITNAYIGNIQAPGLLAGGKGSFLSLDNVTFSKIQVQSSLGKFDEGSVVSFANSHLSDIHAQEGIEVQEGSLLVNNSDFQVFDFSLFQGVDSNVTIHQSHFHHGVSHPLSLASKTAFGGVLGCLDCPHIFLHRCEVWNVSAKFGGAVAARRTVTNAVLFLSVDNSRFEGCSATMGGAIIAQNVSITIRASSFIGNWAETVGGALLIALKPSHSGSIIDSVFTRNSAVEGGAVKWSNAEVQFVNTSFQSNLAQYGPDIASYGVALSSQLTRLTKKEASGFPLTLVFELLDHYGHRVTISPFRSLTLLSTSAVSYRGNQISILSSGLFNYSDLTVYAAPNSSQLITGQLSDSQEDFSLSIVGNATVVFRTCSPGEIGRKDRCEPCYAGNFSFFPEDAHCSFCPANAFCPGGNELHVSSGYWRSGLNSSQVFLCPYPSKCKGGVNSTCAEGSDGVMCNLCASGFYRKRTAECDKCSHPVVHVLQIAVALALNLATTLLTVRLSEQKLYVLKIVIGHFQFLSVLSYLRLSYSPVLTHTLHGVMYISSLLLPDLPLACFGVKHPEMAKVVIGTVLLPLHAIITVLICRFIAANWKFTALKLVSSSFLFLPWITLQAVAPLLACWSLNTEELLFLDLEVKCWEGIHPLFIYALLLPSVLLYVLVPWLLVLICFYSNQHTFRSNFPMWTCGYQWPLWEVFIYLSKGLLLVLVQVTITSTPLVQFSYLLVCFIVICCVNVSTESYAYSSSRYFLLSEASMLAVALCVGFLSFYLYYPTGTETEGFIVAMVLLLNLVFLLLAGLELRSKVPHLESVASSEGPIGPCSSPAGPVSTSFLQ